MANINAVASFIASLPHVEAMFQALDYASQPRGIPRWRLLLGAIGLWSGIRLAFGTTKGKSFRCVCGFSLMTLGLISLFVGV